MSNCRWMRHARSSRIHADVSVDFGKIDFANLERASDYYSDAVFDSDDGTSFSFVSR
jgi:hypothetical protein